MMSREFLKVGKPVVRQDGLEKVTGQAKFADDYYFPGQLYGVMVRLPVSHAEINKIDYSVISNEPGLWTICDARDIRGEKIVGLVRQDQPVFCNEKIVTPGDVVAMLVGESPEALIPMRKKIKIDYTPLPVLTDPRKALAPDAPLIHPQYKNNLIVHYPLRKGNIETGFAESDFTLEQTYTTPHVEHAYIEPEAVIALPQEGNKGIKIIGSIQNPFSTRKIVAAVLGWSLVRVRVQQAELGGSFGGKDDLMCILSARAAVGALKTGRPVKIRYSREESIMESYKRHPYIMHYKVGFNKDGKIKVMKIDILADGGAYASLSPFVTWRSVVQATGPYEIENVWTDVRAVYTNNPYTGAMRGFGSPQIVFAQESLMDEIAVKLGMSPEEIRKINGLRSGSITASGQKLENHDVNLVKVLETAVKHSNFTSKWRKNHKNNQKFLRGGLNQSVSGSVGQLGDWQAQLGIPLIMTPRPNPETNENQHKRFAQHIGSPRRGAPGRRRQKGTGLAVSYRGCSLGAEGIDAAAAYLSVQSDGSVYLLSGLAENGQGLRTTYSIIAAEVLGISVEDIYYLELDTGLVSDSGPTVASRSTLMGGGAVKAAAEIVRQRLEELLKKQWNLKDSEFTFKNHQVSLKGKKKQKISFADLCNLAYGNAVSMAAVGWYPGPKVHWDEAVGQGPAYFTYVYGCQVAEVTVNIVTGEVFIDRVVAVHDPGTVINLLGAQGQVYGGVTQGAGYGLWEEISTSSGSIRELNFDQYLIPTSKDIGEIIPIFVEGKEKYGPWGGKSLGEPTLELTAAAVANAVRNAVGIRYFNLPLNLEEILLQKKLHPGDLQRGSNI
jgi:CO/xanthine dehydrogenase Mo-binding subunit